MFCTCQRCCARFPAVVHVFTSPLIAFWGDQTKFSDIYTYIDTYIYIYIHIYLHMGIYFYMYIYIFICTYIYIYISVCVRVYPHIIITRVITHAPGGTASKCNIRIQRHHIWRASWRCWRTSWCSIIAVFQKQSFRTQTSCRFLLNRIISPKPEPHRGL